VPTPPVVPDTLRVRLIGALPNAAAWGVRFYVGYTGGAPTPANCLAIAEAIGSVYDSAIIGLQDTNVTLSQVDVVDLSTEYGSSATADVDYHGSGVSGAVDNQIAAVVKFEIARRYRGGKPKMFIPGIESTYQEDGSHWTEAFCNDMGTAFTTFNSDIAEITEGSTDLAGIVNVSLYQGFTAVENPVTHRYRNVPTYRETPLIDTVESFTCDSLMGTQKRRRTA